MNPVLSQAEREGIKSLAEMQLKPFFQYATETNPSIQRGDAIAYQQCTRCKTQLHTQEVFERMRQEQSPLLPPKRWCPGQCFPLLSAIINPYEVSSAVVSTECPSDLSAQAAPATEREKEILIIVAAVFYRLLHT